MNYLLDTCFISELRKPEPNKLVLEWFNTVEENSLFISALTIGELRYGIALLPENAKRNDLEDWLRSIENSFNDMIIPIDEKIAGRWGEMRAAARARGNSLSVIDGLLAATCDIYELILVTRNEKDFEATGIRINNTWE